LNEALANRSVDTFAIQSAAFHSGLQQAIFGLVFTSSVELSWAEVFLNPLGEVFNDSHQQRPQRLQVLHNTRKKEN